MPLSDDRCGITGGRSAYRRSACDEYRRLRGSGSQWRWCASAWPELEPPSGCRSRRQTGSWADSAPDAVAILLPAEGGEKNSAPAKDKPADADWLPKSDDDKGTVPSRGFQSWCFLKRTTPKAREENFKKMCPRLSGETAIVIAATDNTLQKLPKARLHQGIVDLQRRQTAANVRGWDVASMQARQEICKDIQETVTELWAGQPKELVPWLEELVVMAKDYERFIQIRLNAGNALPTDLNAVTRYRLSAEATLWKAKNGK